MVTAISLARKRGEDQSPGSHTDFVSHSTGQLVWGISSPSGSRALSLGARALFSCSRAVPSTFISIFRLNSFTSYRLLSVDWGLFQIFSPSRLVYRGIETVKSDILSPFRSRRKQGFSMFESLCQITQQTWIFTLFIHSLTGLGNRDIARGLRFHLVLFIFAYINWWTTHESHTLTSCVLRTRPFIQSFEGFTANIQ